MLSFLSWLLHSKLCFMLLHLIHAPLLIWLNLWPVSLFFTHNETIFTWRSFSVIAFLCSALEAMSNCTLLDHTNTNPRGSYLSSVNTLLLSFKACLDCQYSRWETASSKHKPVSLSLQIALFWQAYIICIVKHGLMFLQSKVWFL